MKKETVRTLLIVVGVLVLLGIVGLGTAAWLFARSFNFSKTDAASATQRFDDVRRRFAGVTPILEIRDEQPVLVRRPPEHSVGIPVGTLRIVAWDADENTFAQIDLPFWLLRLKSGPIEIASNSTRWDDTDLGITVEELERYGPTLVLDHEARRGDRVIVWTE